jgi:hypothetical protein
MTIFPGSVPSYCNLDGTRLISCTPTGEGTNGFWQEVECGTTGRCQAVYASDLNKEVGEFLDEGESVEDIRAQCIFPPKLA